VVPIELPLDADIKDISCPCEDEEETEDCDIGGCCRDWGMIPADFIEELVEEPHLIGTCV